MSQTASDVGEQFLDRDFSWLEFNRRVLAQFPQRHMLLARAKSGGGWSALGIADGEIGMNRMRTSMIKP